MNDPLVDTPSDKGFEITVRAVLESFMEGEYPATLALKQSEGGGIAWGKILNGVNTNGICRGSVADVLVDLRELLGAVSPNYPDNGVVLSRETELDYVIRYESGSESTSETLTIVPEVLVPEELREHPQKKIGKSQRRALKRYEMTEREMIVSNLFWVKQLTQDEIVVALDKDWGMKYSRSTVAQDLSRIRKKNEAMAAEAYEYHRGRMLATCRAKQREAAGKYQEADSLRDKAQWFGIMRGLDTDERDILGMTKLAQVAFEEIKDSKKGTERKRILVGSL